MNSAVPAPDTVAKRPRLVWAILVLYAFGLVITLASIYAIFSRALRLPARDAAFYAGFRTLNFLGLGLSAILATGFMVQLFRMRKSAAYFAIAGFLVLIVKELLYQPQLVRLGHSLAPAVIGVVIAFLIVRCTWHLKRTGALR
jgi:cell division protein FtsW (lipid II flippase)